MKPPGLWLSTDPDMAALRLNYKEKTEKYRKVFELLEIPVRLTLLGKITVTNYNWFTSNHWFIVPFAVRRLNCRIPYKL